MTEDMAAPVVAVEHRLIRIIDHLADRFDGVFSRETITACVEESYELLAANSKVTGFLPVLTEKFARERLAAVAKVDGLLPPAVPEVLFLCVHNAGRSQMAAALMEQLSHGQVHVRSAGSQPRGEIDDTVRSTMAEVGIELDEAFPKPMTDDVVRASDVIVTMGCGDACPVYPGKRYVDWDLPDPTGLSAQQVRAIRDEITDRVRALIQELRVDQEPTAALPSETQRGESKHP